MKNLAFAAACAAPIVLTSFAVDAGGFALRERSANAQGASFAGSTAAANDVTYMLFNPAALRSVESIEAGGAFSLILPDITGTAQVNGQDARPGVVGLVPASAFGYRVNEDLVIGIGAYSPFGLTTDYDENFIGAFDGIHSELISLAVSPTIAYDVTDSITIGASGQIIYNDPQLTGATGINTVTGEIQETKLDATEWEWSAAFGVLIDVTDDTTIGATLHSGYDITTGGTLRSFAGNTPIELQGDASINLPATISAGFKHRFNDEWSIMGEVEFARWSEFDEIRVDVAALAPNNDIGEVTNYKDSWFFALGAEYKWSDELTLRGGVAYDQTPTQLNGRSIRIPDADRIWASVGLTYQLSESMKLDAGYSLIFFMDEQARLLNGPAAGTLIDYEGQTHILSVGGTLTF
ncbi:MAG: outer membrane protein transport protein [Pseudomonadota bacterium]